MEKQSFWKENKELKILLVSIIISYIVHLFLLVFFPKTHQWYIFFEEGRDFFADFFNVVRYTSNYDVYLNPLGKGLTNYLPLAFMLLYPFVWLLDFNNMTLKECWANPQAILCALFFTVVSLIFLIHSMYCLIKQYKTSKLIFIPLLLSNVLFFSIERGNWIIITAAGIYYFLAFYESEEKRLRYFAATSLVIASVLKVYPVFLGLLYLQRKDYKIIMYCFLMGILLSILPFLAFKSGFRAIPSLIDTLKINSEVYSKYLNPKFGIPYLFYGFGLLLEKFFHVPESVANNLLNISLIISRIICIYALFLSFKTKDYVYKLLLLIMAILFFPAHSEYYCGLFFFPIIILLFSKIKERTRVEKVVFLLFFFILLQDIQIVYGGRYNLSRLFVDCVTICFFIYIIIKNTWVLLKQKKN